MKYKTLKIPGHPRSGSHWINRLIDVNFFDGSDYLRHYGGHPWGGSPRAQRYFNEPKQAVIYTYRNIPDTCKSVYNMRHRFGLAENNYDQFLKRKMSSMFNPNLNAHTIRDTMQKVDNVTIVDKLLRNQKRTVPEYMEQHHASWLQHISKPNFIMVKYDDLAGDFQKTMLKIAKFLGSDKTEFVDENKRVGWRATSDNAWTKP